MDNNMKELINSISTPLSYSDVIAAEVLAKISATIFRARIDRGMTQKEFASLLGVSQGMVSKWESEDYNFTVEALANICEKLDWDLSIVLKPRSSKTFSHIGPLTGRPWMTNNTTRSNTAKIGVAS